MKFSIYNASAGSGKTYTLVKEYLKMAFEHQGSESFRRILAITFTNKAAAEMKERIIAALEGISEENPDYVRLLETLVKETGRKPEELIQRSGEILRAILHQYSDFSISTIDSFMHRVVRTFAFDLHLPVSFSIELNKENLIEQAVDQLIAQAGFNEEVTKILKGFTESRAEEEKSFHIRSEMISTASDLLDDQKAMAIGLLRNKKPADFLEIRQQLIQEIHRCEQAIQKLGIEGLELINKEGLVNEDFYYGNRGVPGLFLKASNYSIASKPLGNTYTEAALKMDKWTGKGASKNTISAIENISGELKNIIEKIIEFDKNEAAKGRLYSIMLNEIYSMALLNEISGIIDSIRNEQHVMHISEFNRRVAEIVFHEPAPFIFERLGERYHHYLIDEFQDTSVLQWQNLLPLVHNGLASNANSLIVGDGKQAIYRFRGGDVEQFIRLPHPYPEALTEFQLERYLLLKQAEQKVPLESNFRSLPEIVKWNNAFFQFTSTQWLSGEYQAVYSDLNQKSHPDKKGGLVQIEFLNIARFQGEQQGFEERALSIVKECVEEKKYNYSDIAILTRSNKQGNELAVELLKANIPVVSTESLLVSSSQEVQFLLAWFRVLANQNTDVQLIQILYYLIQNQKLPFNSLETLLEEIKFSEEKILSIFSEHGYPIPLSLWRTQALPETCHQICRTFELEIQLNPFLQFFIESVWFSTQQISPDIPGFLEYWEESGYKLSISLPQNANAVKIMTVHKSKGLEFPVVILPCGGNENRKSDYTWVTGDSRIPFDLPAIKLKVSSQLTRTDFSDLYELEENRRNLDMINLLYVANTRPQDALFILSKEYIPDSESSGWASFLSSFIASQGGENLVSEGVYAWGDRDFKASEHAKKKTRIKEEKGSAYKGGGWLGKIQIARASEKIWNQQGESEAVAFGKLSHLALSWIHHKEDAPAAIARLIEEGHARLDEAERIHHLINKVLNMPELDSIYNASKVYTERLLMDEEGELHRPDRVSFCDDTLWVLDYKTGLPSPKHLQQMQRYLRKIAEIETAVHVKGLLIYLKENPEIQIIE